MTSELAQATSDGAAPEERIPDRPWPRTWLLVIEERPFLWFAAMCLVTGSAGLMRQSPWMDELLTMVRANSGFYEGVKDSFKEFHLPFYPVLVWVFSLGGTSVLGARLLSVIAFAIGGGLMPLVGRRLFDEKTAIFAAFLYVFSPILIWHAQDARHYTALIASCLATLHASLIIGEKGWQRIAWLAFVAFIGLVTHLYFVAFLCAVGLHALLRIRTAEGKRALLALVIAGLCALPILIALMMASRGFKTGFEKPVTLATLGYPLLTYGFGYAFGPTNAELHAGAMQAMRPYIGRAISVIALFWIPVAIAAWVMAQRERTKFLHSIGYCVIPLALPFLAGLLSKNGTFNVRYALAGVIMPMFYAAYAMAHGPMKLRAISKIAVFGVEIAGLGFHHLSEAHFKEDYRATSAWVAAHASRTDPIHMAPVKRLFRYMIRGYNIDEMRESSLRDKSPRVLYVIGRPWVADPRGKFRAQLLASPRLRAHKQFNGFEVFVHENPDVKGLDRPQ